MEKRSELVGMLGTIAALAAVASAAYSGSNGGLYSNQSDTETQTGSSLAKTLNHTGTHSGFDRAGASRSSQPSDAFDVPTASVTASL